MNKQTIALKNTSPCPVRLKHLSHKPLEVSTIETRNENKCLGDAASLILFIY
jgi:hypothetical protein